MLTYDIDVAGLKRTLPLCHVSDDLYIAAFVIFGDVELTVHSAAELLKRCGSAPPSCPEALETLRRRVLSEEGFPHEIGVFLGYPLPDVLGYIQNRGKNSKLTGFWQVYGDADEAARSFRRYRKCSELYRRLYDSARGLMQLTVGA